jgi:antitoxin ParD1/3/4
VTGTLTIELSPEQSALVREQVARGLYPGPEEVVGEALRLLDERDRLERLRAALRIGQEQLDRGEGRPFTREVLAEIRASARRRAEEGDRPHDDVLP